jgi:hypothetical protein
VRPNITLHSLSGKTKHYIILPLWKDQTLHYTPSLERPNITLYSPIMLVFPEREYNVMLVFPKREYNVMFGLSREGV